MRTLEVFAEVLCPFAHVGLRTVIDRRTGDPALAAHPGAGASASPGAGPASGSSDTGGR